MAPSGPQPLTPTALRKDGPDRFVIEWNDGHHSVYTWRHLRENCPCASCREEQDQPPDPLRVLKPGELLPPAAVRCRASAVTPTRSSGTTATKPAFILWNICVRCVSVRNVQRKLIMQPPGPASQKFELPNIQYLVAVASGKGGVGKSTVAANLALALAKRGKRVGLMDADIYGPSIPTMLGIGDVDPQTTPFPIERHGLEVMSMGFLLGPDKAAILRGPMVQQYLLGFLTQIDWGRLDYLLVDMPPGTGDAQLALAQTAPVAGTIIVTTPQDVSLNVARRGVEMFRQVQVPVLGIVENMSYLYRRRRQTLRHLPPRRRPQAGGGSRACRSWAKSRSTRAWRSAATQGEPVVHRYPDSAGGARRTWPWRTTVDKQLRRGAGPKELPEVQL